MDRERVSRFVDRWLEDETVTTVSVMHVGDRGASVLDSIETPSNVDDRPVVEDVVERFDEAVSGHAASSSHTQRYAVAAVARGHGGINKTLAQCFFRIAPDATADLAILDSEPPTGRGIVKQAMRHAEAMMRMQLAAMNNTLGHLANQNQALVGRVQSLEATHFERVRLVEDLLSQRHERELESARQKSAAERNNRLFTQAESLVPVLASRISGSTDTVKLLQTFSPEQIGALAGSLTPAQRELFDKIIATAQGEEKALAQFVGGGAPGSASAPAAAE